MQQTDVMRKNIAIMPEVDGSETCQISWRRQTRVMLKDKYEE